MASASSSPAPNLPKWIFSVYAFVSFFNFDTNYVVHETCMNDKDPYLTSTLLLAGILGVTLMQACLFVGVKCLQNLEKEHAKNAEEKAKKRFIWVAHVQGSLFIAMSFAFPLIARNVLKFLHCEMDAKTGELVLADGSARTVCWGEKHVGIGVLAIVVLLTYVLAYPIASGCYLRKIVHAHTKSAHRLARWDHFISDDYQPRYYWFRHLYWAVNFGLLFVCATFYKLGKGVPVHQRYQLLLLLLLPVTEYSSCQKC